MWPNSITGPEPRERTGAERGVSHNKPRAPVVTVMIETAVDLGAKVAISRFSGDVAASVRDALLKFDSSSSDGRLLGAKMLERLCSPLPFTRLLEAAEKETAPYVKKAMLKALCCCANGAEKPPDTLERLERIVLGETDDSSIRQAVYAIYHCEESEHNALTRIMGLVSRAKGEEGIVTPTSRAIREVSGHIFRETH